MKKRIFTPENITNLKDNEIFVFGSNLNGNHSGGAAKLALDKFGAIQGQAEGRQGQSYAIPTLNENMKQMPLTQIDSYIREFASYASKNMNIIFYVTKIGCGIAGFQIAEIALLFKRINFSINVALPIEFCETKGYNVFNHD